MKSEENIKSQLARYMLCFNNQCNKREHCLRYNLTEVDTSDVPCISIFNPVCYPKKGEDCSFFRTNKKIRMAWGFKNLYDDMPARIAHAIHLSLESFFGHTSYYRYHNQKLGLTPQQQERIRQICLRHGWKEEITFERYTEEYDW